MQSDRCDNPEELMQLFKKTADPAYLEPLILKYLKSSILIAKHYLKNDEMAEDAVQETFLRIIQKRSSFKTDMDFARWYYTVLRNVCCDFHRRRQQFLEKKTEISYFLQQTTSQHDSRIDDTFPLSLLSGLSESERSILILRIVHELSFKEIAAATGIREEAAKKRAQRGLRRLKEKFHAGKMSIMKMA